MTSTQFRFWPVTVKYGVISAIIIIIVFIILFVLGQNPLLTTKKFPFGIIIIPLFIFFGLKEMRDYHNQGILRLWQGLLGGLIIYLTIALISAIFIWAFIRYYNDAILTDYINFNILNIEDKRAALVETYDEATYQDLLQNIRETTAYHIALDEFIRKLLIGFISTFIISIVLRK